MVSGAPFGVLHEVVLDDLTIAVLNLRRGASVGRFRPPSMFFLSVQFIKEQNEILQFD